MGLCGHRYEHGTRWQAHTDKGWEPIGMPYVQVGVQPHRVTAARVYRELAWFRVRGYGLWLKWGHGRDLHITRMTAHRLGRLRWKILSP